MLVTLQVATAVVRKKLSRVMRLVENNLREHTSTHRDFQAKIKDVFQLQIQSQPGVRESKQFLPPALLKSSSRSAQSTLSSFIKAGQNHTQSCQPYIPCLQGKYEKKIFKFVLHFGNFSVNQHSTVKCKQFALESKLCVARKKKLSLH